MRLPAGHSARQVRALVDEALAELDGGFDKLYSRTGLL